MSNETAEVKKESTRTMLTNKDVDLAQELMVYAADAVLKKDVPSESLRRLSLIMRVLSDLCLAGADLHEDDLQIPWQAMCWAAHLSPTMKNVAETQANLERMLSPIWIDVIKQRNPKRGVAFPNFKAVKE